jgi:hypothetical protein
VSARQTCWIRYRCDDGHLVTEGGRWLPLSEAVPSFMDTGMAIHRELVEANSRYLANLAISIGSAGRMVRQAVAPNLERLVAVDAMIWKLERGE